jgi:hexosaminidase
MKKHILFFFSVAFSCFYVCGQVTNGYSILPAPQHVAYTAGTYLVKDSLTLAFPSVLRGEAKLAQEYLSQDFALHPVLAEGQEEGDITLCIAPAMVPQPAGYLLTISEKGIFLTANNEAGTLYGIQTLRQIIKQEGGKWVVQAGTITDYPTFSWRAFMLDEARHFKGKDVVMKTLENMAQLKLNVFHWHLVDDPGWRIEIKKYPDLTAIGAYRDSSVIHTWRSGQWDGKPHGGYYTQDEIREIVAYAAARHITVVPEIEMPGHASASIAAYPWLGTTGKKMKVPGDFFASDIYDVTKPEVIEFLHNVLTEVMELFPSKVIHIGGDEVDYNFWKNAPTITQYMKDHAVHTPADLQIQFTNQMSQWLASKQRRMMGWTEITGAKIHGWQTAEDNITRERLARGTIVHFWQGDQALMKKTIEEGYDIVNSFHEYTYLDYAKTTLEKAYSFNPVPEGLTQEQQQRILGLGCQMWTEFVPDEQNMNEKVYPRIAAYAETGWTAPEKKDYQHFLTALPYFLARWQKQGIELTSYPVR